MNVWMRSRATHSRDEQRAALIKEHQMGIQSADSFNGGPLVALSVRNGRFITFKRAPFRLLTTPAALGAAPTMRAPADLAACVDRMKVLDDTVATNGGREWRSSIFVA